MRARWLLIGGGVAVVALGASAWASRDVYALATLSTVYGAKQTCSCLFIARRSIGSCMTDYEAEEVRSLTWQTTPDSVTVSALGGLISHKSVYEEGFGCHPVD